MNGIDTSLLMTDLYQLTMLQCYRARGMHEVAVFEFFVRALPPGRHFLLAAGLEQAVGFLLRARFGARELAWLRGTGRFDPAFVAALAGWRFTGDVDAVPEGTAVFEQEPLLTVAAPLPEAQLVESRLVNLMQYQTMVASKAARVVAAARGKRVVDFGMRRAHGAEAALLAARACWLAGCDATATVAAGRAFGMPLSGTMAHSFVLAHPSEEAAFEAFAAGCPGPCTLLIDTWDVAAGARTAARLAQRFPVQAVRIDSGDLGEEAVRVRRILDGAGARQVGIFVSGNLDEYAIDALTRAGAPVDGYGAGTKVATSADAPALDCAYKMTVYGGRAVRKRSPGKATWPGAKQVFRQAHGGIFTGDVLGLAGEALPGEALLRPVVRGGRLVAPLPPLADSRARAAAQQAGLPAALRALDGAPRYAVTPSASLLALTAQVDAAAPA